MDRIEVIDSHTGGEPTRVVVSGVPELMGNTMLDKRESFASHHASYRTGIVLEPRGSEILVGALLTEPCDPTCQVGVVFFNNVGVLGMCGHGAIGVIETLKHLGRIQPGEIRLDTPVGVVKAVLQEDGQVSIRNVPSYRYLKGVHVDSHSTAIVGDVAYGGNWFFLVSDESMAGQSPNIQSLMFHANVIKRELHQHGVTGEGGAIIDHIELFGPSTVADSKNFVLCPGGAFDRSPCGTGTSAKMACLYEDGQLQPGEIYRQESITGSIFEGWIDIVDGTIVPTIRGRAWVTAEASLLFDENDPLKGGYSH